MKRIGFWFDPISPYAYLAFDALPRALEGISHVVDHKPLLLAGVLAHWGQKGPAEIEPKRQWTFRQVHWLAAQQGLRLETPAQHPFNPLALLRLAVACTPAGQAGPSRRVVQTLFEHVWHGGGAANDPVRLAALTASLAPDLQRSARDPGSAEVKAALRAATDDAVAQGVFGVPTLVCDDRSFFGQDALPMLRAAVCGDPWFDGPDWQREGAARAGVRRHGA
jgi:2-hydroxychromene-2-carboxylate isomerase